MSVLSCVHSCGILCAYYLITAGCAVWHLFLGLYLRVWGNVQVKEKAAYHPWVGMRGADLSVFLA